MSRVPLLVLLAALLAAVHAAGPAIAPACAQEVADEEPNRGGTARYEALDPAYALENLHVAEGYEVSLFASEQDFPIGNPVSMTFDARGRLWVATMPSYPQRLPDQEPDDKIVILEDRDGDGRADHHVVFARGLHLPTGFELGDGGAYVAQQPNLMFIEDTDGDDVADRYEVILHGFGTEDSHHSISAFTWGPGGALYFQEGTFHHSQVETPYGPVRLVDAGVFRYKPNRFQLEVFVSYRFANPWGHVFDRWGQNFIADASGGSNYFGAPITGNAPYPTKRRRMKVFTSIVRPTSGCEIVSSRHFPEEAQGNFLVNNTIGFQGIRQHRVIEEDSGFTSEEVEPLLYSTDINFRPVDLQFAPDGSLYLIDWFNPLIGHMQYSLRDERRDHDHGRVWRIRHESRPLLEPPGIAGATAPELVRMLEEYEDRTRYRVRRELRERPRAEVLAELGAWLNELDERETERESRRGPAEHLAGAPGTHTDAHSAAHPNLEHHRLEALWLYQNLNAVEPELLDRMLNSPEPRARAAATRVARFWRRELDDPLALLAARVEDPFPRTRLEALLGLSYIESEAAALASLRALDHPTDYYLDYVLGETVDTLERWWLPALASEREPPRRREDPAVAVHAAAVEHLDEDSRVVRPSGRLPARRPRSGARLLDRLPPSEVQYLLSRLSTRKLERLPAHPLTDRALIRRADAGLVRQRQALANLTAGTSAGTSRSVSLTPAALLVAELQRLDTVHPPEPETLDRIVLHLLEQDRATLRASRRELQPLAASATRRKVRSGATAALLAAAGDASPGRILPRRPTPDQLIDWLHAVDQLPPALRGGAWEPVSSLFDDRRGEGRQRVLEAAARTLSGITANARRSFERLAGLAAQAADPALALTALAALGELTAEAPDAWPAAGAGEALADTIVDALERADPRELTSPRYRRIHDLGLRLADRLIERAGGDRGGEHGSGLREKIVNLGPAIVTLRPVPHQMLFDLEEFTVRTGGPVEITFENIDVMPHNVVVTRPGALEDVGRAADAEAARNPASAEGSGYVPKTPLVLWKTGLVQPGGTEVLSFIAPKSPGLYPFVCTFPGHWILMKGTMRVVERLDERAVTRYAAPRLVPDLPQRAFVADWSYDMLEADIRELPASPPADQEQVDRGRRLFVEAGCATCHRLGGVGGEIGPALDDAGERLTALDALRHILEPSDEVADDYRTWLVETRDGRFHSGLLASVDDRSVGIRSNPLDPNHVETIPREDIESLEESPLSPMPSGLLSTLQPSDVQDLIRYVLHSP